MAMLTVRVLMMNEDADNTDDEKKDNEKEAADGGNRPTRIMSKETRTPIQTLQSISRATTLLPGNPLASKHNSSRNIEKTKLTG